MKAADSASIPIAAWKIQRPLRMAQLILIFATAGIFWASDDAFTPLICTVGGLTLLIELMINLRAILFRRWLRSLDYAVCPECGSPLKDRRSRDECPRCRHPYVLDDVRKTWQQPEPFWG